MNNPLVHSMEMEIRQELAFKTPSSITAGFKSDTIKKLRESEDVMFHWCMVSAEWDGKAAERRLEMIIELWLRVCLHTSLDGRVQSTAKKKHSKVQWDPKTITQVH